MADKLNPLSTAEVSKLRFKKIEAEVFDPSKMAAGHLNISVQVSINEATNTTEKETHIAQSILSVIGIPKPAADSTTGESPSFKIEVTVEALISWMETPSQELLNSQHATEELCRPLYAIAVSEAKQLALKIGISNLGIPLDLRRALRDAPIEKIEVKSSKPRGKKKPAIGT